MSYRIEVARIGVTMISTRGLRSQVEVFLRVKDTQAQVRESLGERLNDPDVRFIPVQNGDTVELLSLQSIAYLEAEGELPEVAQTVELGGWREPATLVMLDGAQLEGDLIYSLPHEHRRVSDLLNHGEEFYLFFDGAKTRYVSRRSIASVRTGLDDQLPAPDTTGG